MPKTTHSEIAEQLLEAAARAGADAADALIHDGVTQSIDVRGGALERAERAEGIDIGLRVLIGQKQATVASSDASAEALAMMAERAVAMAREAPDDPYTGLAAPEQLARDVSAVALELEDPSAEPAPADLEEDARRAEAAALGVAGVSTMDGSSATYTRRSAYLAASNGFRGGYARTMRSLSSVAITGEGTKMERDYAFDFRVFQRDLESPEAIGQRAGERAVARAGAKKPPTGRYQVVYDERVSASLIGHLLSASNGSAIARGASWLRDAMGEAVLPAGLSVTEDPLLPRRPGSRPFDAEGLACARREIVADGVLSSWTLDLATARKLGLESTGNAERGTSGPPHPGLTNIALTEGDIDRAGLLAEMGTGLLITSMIGSSINPTTGDYSRGASGFWVENGEITYPVNECTVAGNLRDMLMTLRPANDARHHMARAVPSVLIEGLTIAGA